ncbi:hypothetical protein [Rhizobium hidalgonense]|nr:hypothetical protein [Rhizobium hidalgonense]
MGSAISLLQDFSGDRLHPAGGGAQSAAAYRSMKINFILMP